MTKSTKSKTPFVNKIVIMVTRSLKDFNVLYILSSRVTKTGISTITLFIDNPLFTNKHSNLFLTYEMAL